MPDKIDMNQKVIISKVDRIGIVHLGGIEKYFKKHEADLAFLITRTKPHDNVIKFSETMNYLKITVSKNYQKEIERIKNDFPDGEIVILDPYLLAGRDGMLDA